MHAGKTSAVSVCAGASLALLVAVTPAGGSVLPAAAPRTAPTASASSVARPTGTPGIPTLPGKGLLVVRLAPPQAQVHAGGSATVQTQVHVADASGRPVAGIPVDVAFVYLGRVQLVRGVTGRDGCAPVLGTLTGLTATTTVWVRITQVGGIPWSETVPLPPITITVPAVRPPTVPTQDTPTTRRECHWELLGVFYNPDRRVHKFMLMRCGVSKTCGGHQDEEYGFTSDRGTVDIEALINDFVRYHSLDAATGRRLKDAMLKAAWKYETPACGEAAAIISSLSCKHGPPFCDLYRFTPAHTLPNPIRRFDTWSLVAGQDDRGDFWASRWLDYKVVSNSLVRAEAVAQFLWRHGGAGTLSVRPRNMGWQDHLWREGRVFTTRSFSYASGTWTIKPASEMHWSLEDKCRLINTYEDEGSGEGEARAAGRASMLHKITAEIKTGHHVKGTNAFEYWLENRQRGAGGTTEGTPPDPGSLNVDVKIGLPIKGLEAGFSVGSEGVGVTVGPITLTWKPGGPGQPPAFDANLPLTGSDTGSHTANAHSVVTTHDAEQSAGGNQPPRGVLGASHIDVRTATHAHHGLRTGFKAKPAHAAEGPCGCGAPVCKCDPEARVHLLPWSANPVRGKHITLRSGQASGFRTVGQGGARDGAPTLWQQHIVSSCDAGALTVDGRTYPLLYLSRTKELWLTRTFTNELVNGEEKVGPRLTRDDLYLQRDSGSLWVD